MSRSVCTEVLLGVRFKQSELKRSKKVKNCNHENPATAKFCGECGKLIYSEKTEYIFKDKILDKLYDNKKGEVYLTGTYDNQDKYIGIRLSNLSEKCETEVDMSNLEKKKEKLLNFFQENNLNIKTENIKIYHLLTIY